MLTVARVTGYIDYGLEFECAYVYQADVCKSSTDDERVCVGIEPWKYREVELLDIVEKAIFDHLNWLVVFHNQEISFCQRNDQLICIIFKNLVCLFIFQKY